MSDYSKKVIITEAIVLISISVFLFLIPFIFWGQSKIVGGDDGGLYYLYPLQYLTNFANTIISNNILGGLGQYFSQMYIFGFVGVLSGINILTFNTINIQSISLGLILSGGFLGLYVLLGVWIKSIKLEDIVIKILGSLLYIFSTFSFITIWNSLLFAVYLVLIMPWVYYFILKSIQTNRMMYIILAALILSIFSISILSLAWFAAIIISFVPIFIFQLIQKPKRSIKVGSIFILLLILLNAYWGFHLINSTLSKNSDSGELSTTVNSDEFKDQNSKNIRVVSDNNELIYPLFNLFHYNIQKDFSWRSLPIYENWHKKTFYFQGALILIVILGFIVKKSDKTKSLISIRNIVFISWIVVLWLFTVNIGNWGTNLFLFFNQYIPGFTLFRNMFDKFGLALAFIYALLVAISLAILYKSNINKYVVNGLAILAIIVTIINAVPFIKGDYYKNSIWTTENIYPRLNSFNDNFLSLTNYIEDIDTNGGRFLWTPLNKAGYVITQDKDVSNYYYAGVSPLQILTKQQDYAGTMSFRTFDSDIQTYLQSGKYIELVELLQKMNVQYIIINNDIPLELQNSYLYTVKDKGDLFTQQNNREYLDLLLGEKIKDFGDKYSLYKINPDYLSEKIIVNNTSDKFISDKDTGFQRKSASEYEININNIEDINYYVSFLDPFQSGWELIEVNTKYKIKQHKQILGYANQWEISSEDIKSITQNQDYKGALKFKLYFKPATYQPILYAISGTTLILCLGYLGFYWFRKRRKSTPTLTGTLASEGQKTTISKGGQNTPPRQAKPATPQEGNGRQKKKRSKSKGHNVVRIKK
jgi:hypothetical protein